ncbi:hypothetical protein C2G38_2200405 [Gigaspora rosea]|uniref:Uncharacterized protein n=1 Tax=Gigaspora rosea TaxID=44941 RepID=A0A397USG8_9GLOM|nr:hypothetical protein C2G38_2200405 [Gigaspora rosea]
MQTNATFLNTYRPLIPLIYFSISSTPNTLNHPIDTIDTINPRILGGEGLGSRANVAFLYKKTTAENLIYSVISGHSTETSVDIYHRGWNNGGDVTSIGAVEYLTDENINPLPIIRNTDSKLFKELLINSEASVTSIGAHLCKSGHFSHLGCGRWKPVFSYSPDLQKVSLEGIVRGGLEAITSVVPLKDILDDAKLVLVKI